MAASRANPEVSIVVATHDRPVRLGRLLDALAGQTLAPPRFETIVVHHGEPRTLAVLEGHASLAEGRLRLVVVDPGGSGPAAKRNAGWRAARTATIIFTDDDCRPPPAWLETIATAAADRPDAVIQGATTPDPAEASLLGRPGARTLCVEPPTPWGQTSNIAYPRPLLERVGGFDESFRNPGGEDADLLFRALAAGAQQVAVPGAITHHAVEVLGVLAQIRVARRWSGAVLLVKRHPGFRQHAVLGVFWRARHAWLMLALVGLALGSRWRPALVLVLPYVLLTRPKDSRAPMERLRALARLPATALVDLVEIGTLAQASARYRTLLL